MAEKIGGRMPDGTVYAGISPDTHKPMYTTPADAPISNIDHSFNMAAKYSSRLDAHGHNDWRMPTINELDVLFNNRAAIGGFNETSLDSASWYWSASQSSRAALTCKLIWTTRYFCAPSNMMLSVATQRTNASSMSWYGFRAACQSA